MDRRLKLSVYVTYNPLGSAGDLLVGALYFPWSRMIVYICVILATVLCKAGRWSSAALAASAGLQHKYFEFSWSSALNLPLTI